MQAVGAILGVVGGGVSAIGQLQSSKQEAEAYKYNAAINEADAVSERKKADYEEMLSRRRLKALIGEQETLYGKAGVDLQSGSPLLYMAYTAAQGEEEALNIRQTGDAAVNKKKNEASLNRFYAKQSIKAGKTAAWSAVLGGASNAAASYAGKR